MLVRFIRSGPVQAGPVSIHGLPGQIADLSGTDLETATKDGMVQAVKADGSEPVKPRRARK